MGMQPRFWDLFPQECVCDWNDGECCLDYLIYGMAIYKHCLFRYLRCCRSKLQNRFNPIRIQSAILETVDQVLQCIRVASLPYWAGLSLPPLRGDLVSVTRPPVRPGTLPFSTLGATVTLSMAAKPAFPSGSKVLRPIQKPIQTFPPPA